jgi:ABC-2 type transport system ATP-binding protein
MPSSPPALRLAGLRKQFGASVAVADLDLDVAPGEFFALLGPNGAGKTTTLRMIAGLLEADSGAIEIFGVDARRDPVAAKRIVAWLSDEPMLYDKLDPLEYLEFVSGLWGVPPDIAEERARDLLAALGLWEQRHTRCEGFSRGMKQKVALAGALIHDPKLIILDEPLTGLDAAAARIVKDMLRARTARGDSVVLTTHILEVAERLADRIAIIDRGRLVAQGTCESIVAGVEGRGSLEDAFLDLTRTRSAA